MKSIYIPVGQIAEGDGPGYSNCFLIEYECDFIRVGTGDRFNSMMRMDITLTPPVIPTPRDRRWWDTRWL